MFYMFMSFETCETVFGGDILSSRTYYVIERIEVSEWYQLTNEYIT